MSPTSTTDERFLTTLEEWLRINSEILVQIRYSRAAGNKSFEFFTSFAEFVERMHQLRPETCITAFRSYQLPIRGVVDDEFISNCLVQIQDGSEFLVVETVPRNVGHVSWFHDEAGTSHLELREALESSRGMHVAVGIYPPSLDDGLEVICGFIPDAAGNVKVGVY